MTEYGQITDYETFELGDVRLQSGATLRGAKLAYKTHGTLNERKDNAILYPTSYSATHKNEEFRIGEEKALDPGKYFIIQVNMLANGLSSSPSNTPMPFNQARFPNVTVLDNVLCQHRLVTEKFGIERLALVVGFSMGAQQTFQWGAAFPDMVQRIAPICGTASTTPHNFVFIDGFTSALRADAAWNNGFYDKQPVIGIRAMGRVYAGWGLSQAFYYRRLYLEHGFSSLEDYIVTNWEGNFLKKDANNLLAMAWTWQHADIGMTPGCGGSREKALGSIKAKAMIMPGQTDLYFPPVDVEYEAQFIPGAEVRVIPSVYGHAAGGSLSPEDMAFVEKGLKDLLEME
ncbi:alpha/beta fold hydrolase [Paenibacillus humicola]|uniref:alpha/beta fold hydrolase n=1 Tax=Paenibacillus humicola TaxID=3110540 RepID=UPI00237A9B84|nr:alpha/beta fold hydrolase [Paenibacillus humicola]